MCVLMLSPWFCRHLWTLLEITVNMILANMTRTIPPTDYSTVLACMRTAKLRVLIRLVRVIIIIVQEGFPPQAIKVMTLVLGDRIAWVHPWAEWWVPPPSRPPCCRSGRRPRFFA